MAKQSRGERFRGKTYSYMSAADQEALQSGPDMNALMRRILAKPGAMPESVKSSMMIGAGGENALAAGRARAAVSPLVAGGARSGLARGITGATAAAGGRNLAGTSDDWNRMTAETEMDRIGGMVAPYVGEQRGMYEVGQKLAQANKKKKKNWLKTAAGVGALIASFYTGGATAPLAAKLIKEGQNID